ncbi:MAG: FtsQ-type POTRA domain-containing protein [Terracidiphilus sp.]
MPSAGRTPTPPASENLPPVEDESLPGEERKERSRSTGSRFERPRNPWWRPATSAGRTLLALATLTVLTGCAASAYLLKNYIDRDARFRIAGTGNIEASGLTEVSRSEMLPVFGEDIGRNIFYVPLSERRRQLEQLPWVERASVMRLLPDQIRVSIVERQPVAFALQPNGLTGLVDADGVLLTMPAAMMSQRHYSFPVVSGINAGDSLDARRARMAVYLRLLSELDSGGQKISNQISDVDLSDPEVLRIRMQDDPTLLVIGQERFLERYLIYKQKIAEWRQQHPDLVSVDLRIEQRAVLSMPEGTNTAQAVAAEENAPTAKDAADSHPDGKEKDVAAQSHPVMESHPGNKTKSVAKVGHSTTGRLSKKAKPPLKSAKVKAKAREMKRAAVKKAAQHPGKQRSIAASHPAPSAGMGQ